MVLENVKKGDMLEVWRYGRLTKEPVEYVIATQVIAGGDRFMRKTGNQVGRGNYGSARPWTSDSDQTLKELTESSDVSRLAGHLRAVRWGYLPMADLAKIRQLLIEMGHMEEVPDDQS